jgi:hypothetical protein
MEPRGLGLCRQAGQKSILAKGRKESLVTWSKGSWQQSKKQSYKSRQTISIIYSGRAPRSKASN